MSSDDQALILEFVTESRDHLSHIEGHLLQIESNGSNIDVELVNEVFRGSIQLRVQRVFWDSLPSTNLHIVWRTFLG